jgi:protein-S-isoprenylcysteine O-methyltransferase Ste14
VRYLAAGPASELTRPSFWNGAPLFVFAGLAASLVYKLPIEEKMLEQGSVGDAYGHYRFRVRHRLIPYVY